jgi:hypothetical protein
MQCNISHSSFSAILPSDVTQPVQLRNVLTGWLSNSKKNSSSSEGDGHSDGREIPHVLWTRKFIAVYTPSL